MADVTDMDSEHAASLQRRYLIRFEEDTLRQRPLWIRLIIEFLGTFVLIAESPPPMATEKARCRPAPASRHRR